MGTVTLTQNGTNDVTVTISLVSPLEILNTGLQQTIDFNLLNTPTITATNFTNPLFSLTNSTAGSQHFDGFQNFEYAIQLNTSQGAGGEQPSPLSFDISGSGVTEASFLTDGTGAIAFFGVDVINTASGRTGPIAANTLVSSTPLPGAAVLFGSVLFGGLGVSGWRKRRARGAVSVIA
jgi:hypothetical protein